MSKITISIVQIIFVLAFSSIFNSYGQSIFLKKGIYSYIDKDIIELENVNKVVKKSKLDLKKVYKFNNFGKVYDFKLFNKLRLISHFSFEYNDKGYLEKIYCLYDFISNKHGKLQLYEEFKYKLDSLDRVLTEFEVSKSDTIIVTNYSYDSINRVVEYAAIIDKVALAPYKIELTYDKNGNIKSQCEFKNSQNYLCWIYDYINNDKVNVTIENNQEGNLLTDKRVCIRKYDNKGNYIKSVTYVKNADTFIEKRKIKYN